ncbi:DUF4097 domain-containing protein [Empedobacter falsenii]
MIKRTVFLAVTTLCMLTAQAQTKKESKDFKSEANVQQTYKLAVNNGKLKISIGNAIIEGYDGKEVLISSKSQSKKEDERAKGLRPVYASGLGDNTGLGINVVQNNGIVEINQLNRISSSAVTIKVPKNMLISYDYQSMYGGEVVFRNIESEIEASSNYNSIQLENVTGPATINSVYGEIVAKFNQQVKGPLSLVSIYGAVDVSVPKTAKADVKLSTSFGEILMAPELGLKIEKKTTSDSNLFNSQLNSKLNGGGTSFNFRSDYGKIYLRAL